MFRLIVRGSIRFNSHESLVFAIILQLLRGLKSIDRSFIHSFALLFNKKKHRCITSYY